MTLIYVPERMEIDLNGRLIRLTTNEAAVMELLWKSNGDVCSPDDIGVYLYGIDGWYDGDINVGVIEKYISHLRKRMAPYGHNFIKTVKESGWYFSQYEPDSIQVEVTPDEAILLRSFRSLDPIEQEMVMASQALAAQRPKQLTPPRVSPPRAISDLSQPVLFDYAGHTH